MHVMLVEILLPNMHTRGCIVMRNSFHEMCAQNVHWASYLLQPNISSLTRRETLHGRYCFPKSIRATDGIVSNGAGITTSWRIDSSALNADVEVSACEWKRATASVLRSEGFGQKMMNGGTRRRCCMCRRITAQVPNCVNPEGPHPARSHGNIKEHGLKGWTNLQWSFSFSSLSLSAMLCSRHQPTEECSQRRGAETKVFTHTLSSSSSRSHTLTHSCYTFSPEAETPLCSLPSPFTKTKQANKTVQTFTYSTFHIH